MERVKCVKKEDFLRPGVSFWESGVQILQVSAFFGKCQMFFAATLCQLMVVSSFAVYRQTQKNLAVICFVTIHDCSWGLICFGDNCHDSLST